MEVVLLTLANRQEIRGAQRIFGRKANLMSVNV